MATSICKELQSQSQRTKARAKTQSMSQRNKARAKPKAKATKANTKHCKSSSQQNCSKENIINEVEVLETADWCAEIKASEYLEPILSHHRCQTHSESSEVSTQYSLTGLPIAYVSFLF